MATVPLSGTNIRLLSGVPFSNDYKHTRWFDDVTSQTNYFLGKNVVHSVSQQNFQRIEGKNFISVSKSIDELWSTNYLMFQNATYNSKWFYGFVTKLEYIQKNTTYVHFEIDVFQTWKFEMNVKPSFVIREHCTLWNSTNGEPIVNTVDEGLNYGTEYDTTSIINFQPNDGYKWLVIVAKTLMHDGATKKINPSVIGTPQPLSVYITPFKDNDSVPSVYLAKNAVGVLVSKPTDVLTGLYLDTDAVNNIVSLYITDFTGLPVTIEYGSPDTLTFPDNGNELEPVQFTNGSGGFFNCLHVTKVIDFGTITDSQGLKYTGYNSVTESKLLMYPYTQVILDDFKGNRVTFKNEYINNPNLEILLKGSLGTSNKVSYGVQDYNFDANGLKENLSDEYALINNEPNDVPIITDLLSAYLQGHKNSLQNQRNAIQFDQYAGIAGGAIGLAGNALSGNIGGVASSMTGIVKGAGDGVLKLQGIQAKTKDIANTPPSIAKMGSNTSYTLGNNYNGVYIIKKQIKPEYIRKLTDFFNMYGYKLNEVKLPNFHTRNYWNYVQTSSCNITGNFNHEDLQEIKSVFDNGITFWHTDDIGNYSLENGVI
jgi:hypothetical protein